MPDAASSPTSLGLFVGASPDWQLKEQQVAAGDAFRNGLPTDADGNLDMGAMVRTLYTKGDYANANALAQTAIAQQQLRAASVPSPTLSGTGTDGSTSTATPSSGFKYTPPSAGFDDAVNRTLAFEGEPTSATVNAKMMVMMSLRSLPIGLGRYLGRRAVAREAVKRSPPTWCRTARPSFATDGPLRHSPVIDSRKGTS